MARITVEDCLENCENRFALVHIASKRARELYKGVEPLLRCKNREVVTALREIAAKKIQYIDDHLHDAPLAPAPSKRSKKS
jgi:DNA-directed RNA polymerase subunit omega